ncbi:MAG: DNA polymerase III subunit delta' [Roseomonas sp.]|nr:DNA polymerase III subunit delta' [Roseomonas sp.]MCA3343807.1 DNA polymerase III subunit delta' [Roseomonas sp.]
MSLPEPRANPELFGHETAAAALVEAALSGRLHHAWLMAGPAGIGKETLAWRFARWLLAGMPEAPKGKPPLYLEPTHPVFRRVAAESHADLLTIDADTLRGDRKRNDINVDAARLIPGFMNRTAAEGGWRVVVVDGVETMNLQAQNAILKVLEEPPARAILLLVSSAPARLLPTIRSRCRRLDLFPLAEAEMQALLARLLPDAPAADRTKLAEMAEGSPGRAMQLAEGDGLELQALVEDCLANLKRPDPARFHAVAERCLSDRGGGAFVTFMALLRGRIAGALRQAARGEAAPGWIAAHPLAAWPALWDRLGRLVDETERLNLDRKQAVLTGLSWLSA